MLLPPGLDPLQHLHRQPEQPPRRPRARAFRPLPITSPGIDSLAAPAEDAWRLEGLT